ncbi:hypothetical protein ACHELOUS_195 [Vibrio phage Achelous]|uniref:Uncharacterized protein n=1 Tax=Vibrio phage Achelous TaxID=2576872 RepID=A0A4P8MVE5_9CAUD|nr:hypothetical protein KNU52_gp100 [Vibrio phage Achelous]QCQ57770.1 hypothetical protein ACHELOUS_195 [Vibrio phage Achelous]
MKFVIGNPVAPKYTNAFVLVTEWMHGDADAYTKESTVFDSNTPCTKELEEEIYMLGILSAMFKHGMGGCDTYAQEANRLGIVLPDKFLDAIPYDHTCEEGDACYKGFKLWWYDNAGVQHPVAIEDY